MEVNGSDEESLLSNYSESLPGNWTIKGMSAGRRVPRRSFCRIHGQGRSPASWLHFDLHGQHQAPEGGRAPWCPHRAVASLGLRERCMPRAAELRASQAKAAQAGPVGWPRRVQPQVLSRAGEFPCLRGSSGGGGPQCVIEQIKPSCELRVPNQQATCAPWASQQLSKVLSRDLSTTGVGALQEENLVGVSGAAKILGTTADAVYKLIYRGRIPEPDVMVDGHRCWFPATIQAYAREARRGPGRPRSTSSGNRSSAPPTVPASFPRVDPSRPGPRTTSWGDSKSRAFRFLD